MTLYLIGLGLENEKDISIKGLEVVKKADVVYIEEYTSLLQCSHQDLAKFYNKEIVVADRATTEQGAEKIVEEAKDKEVAFLVIGDPFSATTHVELFRLAKEKNVPVQIINNASVVTAVGIVGLELYKYGKTTSIPFVEDHPELETPYNVIKDNVSLGLHTLCLLDLKPREDKFMTIKEALDILEKIEQKKQESIIHDDLLVIGCARLGNKDYKIKAGKLKDVKEVDFGPPPFCLIIPGRMHFVEEEMLENWK